MRLPTFSLLFLLAGCASQAPVLPVIDPSRGDALEQILEVSVADIRAAHELAIAAGDEPAKACWPVLEEWVAELAEYRGLTAPMDQSPGVATTYQRIRNIRRQVGSGVPEQVEIACSAMVHESAQFILRLAARLGL